MHATAHHYAEALRATAPDAVAFDALLDELARAAEALTSDAVIGQFFADPAGDPQRQVQVLHDSFQDTVSERAHRVLQSLAENHQVPLLAAVVAAGREIASRTGGVARATVTTAVSLTEAMRVRVEERVRERTGSGTRVAFSVDPSVVGGLCVTVDGSHEWDGTIAARLRRLQRHIAGSTT